MIVASGYLRGRWVVELAEMVATTRSEIESVKAFVSRQVEIFRPPYGRAEVHEARRCVFIGTTNRRDYLRDETGNRRFWPVKVGRIDVEAITRDRDQLWAEAVKACRDGGSWWLSPETERTAFREQAERQEDDPWTGAVVRAIADRSDISCTEILEHLGVPRKDMGRRDTLRVAGILQRLGWSRAGQFSSGERKGLARYVPERGRVDATSQMGLS